MDCRVAAPFQEGAIVKQYVGWVIGLEEATALARICQRAAREGAGVPAGYPVERAYAVPDDVRRALGMGE